MGLRFISATLCASALFCGLSTAAFAQSSPAPRAFNSIEVEGNSRFRDGDVIATSGLETGVVLGRDDLVAAVEALEYTGEFEDIVITSRGETLIIKVEEAPEYSGGLTFGIGFDSDSGVFGAAGLSLDNAFGNGTAIRSNLLIAEEVQNLRFQIQNESFWGDGLRGGVRASLENYDYDNTTYDYRAGRIEPFLAFPLGQVGAVELRYTLASREIRNVSATASPIIQAEAGRQTSSGIGFSIATGSAFLDSEGGPLDAWSLRFDQDFTGLGGDTKYATSKLSFAGRKSLSPGGVAIRTRIELGAVNGWGSSNPRASERFTLGGSALRGFERGTVSPRDVCLGCGAGGANLITNLGGNYFAVARTDIIVPVFKDRPKIETFAFFDVGSVWKVDTTTAPAGTLRDEQAWRSSFGIGASFDTELGKFEAYVALGTDGEQFDEEQQFGLTFRTQF